MILRMKISELEYADAACKALAMLRERVSDNGSAASKLLCTAVQLPDELVYSVFDAVSQEDKNEILVRLVQENKEKLLDIAARTLKQNGIDVAIGDVTVNRELEVSAVLSRINYLALAEMFFPMLRNEAILSEDQAAAILHMLLKLPTMLIRGALDKLPQRKKDELVVYLINRYRDAILRKIMELADNNGIRLRLENLSARI